MDNTHTGEDDPTRSNLPWVCRRGSCRIPSRSIRNRSTRRDWKGTFCSCSRRPRSPPLREASKARPRPPHPPRPRTALWPRSSATRPPVAPRSPCPPFPGSRPAEETEERRSFQRFRFSLSLERADHPSKVTMIVIESPCLPSSKTRYNCVRTTGYLQRGCHGRTSLGSIRSIGLDDDRAKKKILRSFFFLFFYSWRRSMRRAYSRCLVIGTRIDI